MLSDESFWEHFGALIFNPTAVLQLLRELNELVSEELPIKTRIKKPADAIPQGCGGRWSFGVVILVYVMAYNETSGPTVVFSTFLAAIYGLISAVCKSGVRHLQIPYIRASNKFDFMCLFLATWMDVLAILAACGAIARTLSTCLDTMTGGLARILILGRNSPPNEPWPDVLGVTVVFLVTGMFMLGLENTRAFSVLMTFGTVGLGIILSTVSFVKGTSLEWEKDYFLPNGASSFLTAAALGVFAYPGETPNKQGWKKLMGVLLLLLVSLSMILAAGCLSTIVHLQEGRDYTAVPIFPVLESAGFQKLIPAAACLLLLSSSGAFLELFPELYNLIVRLATSEWKILARQISYESPDSGNPVLAIFIGGSLCAMLAFACPMQNLTHMLAASHICAGIFRAFYWLYSPFRPKYIQQTCDSNLSYSRLSTAPPPQSTSSRKRSIWKFNVPVQNTIRKSLSNKKLTSKKEVEKEWLLLGEPSSPCPVPRDKDVESCILSDAEPQASDFEYAEKAENSESDTSTDIDAVVDEYRQKIKVTTAGPMEKAIRVPSVASWRVTILAIVVIIFGIFLTVLGCSLHLIPAYAIGLTGLVIVSIMMSCIPKYVGNITNISPIICTIAMTLGSLLLSSCLAQSWPAIIFWLTSGVFIAIRCDAWCCLCLERPTQHQIIPSVSGKTAIRIPRPPKGFVIPGRIQGHR